MNWFEWLPALSAGAAALGVVGATWRYVGAALDKRREYAAVFAWLALEDGKSIVVTRNLGDKPVLDVTVEIFGGMWRFGLLDAGSRVVRDAEHIDATASDSADPLGLWCTDFTGRRWYRSESGQFYRWNWFGKRRYELARWIAGRPVRKRWKWRPRRKVHSNPPDRSLPPSGRG